MTRECYSNNNVHRQSHSCTYAYQCWTVGRRETNLSKCQFFLLDKQVKHKKKVNTGTLLPLCTGLSYGDIPWQWWEAFDVCKFHFIWFLVCWVSPFFGRICPLGFLWFMNNVSSSLEITESVCKGPLNVFKRPVIKTKQIFIKKYSENYKMILI